MTRSRSSTSRVADGRATARYANGVKLVLRNDGWLPLGSCPVRFEGDAGWVETGDSGKLGAQLAGPAGRASPIRRDRRPAGHVPCPRFPRLRQVARAAAGQRRRGLPVAHRLPRRQHRDLPGPQAGLRSQEERVPRRRRSQPAARRGHSRAVAAYVRSCRVRRHVDDSPISESICSPKAEPCSEHQCSDGNPAVRRWPARRVAAGVAAADDAAPMQQQKLIAVLRSDAPPAEKAIACKRLAICGGKEAVPALAPLLADEELASWARIALEAIPDPAADDALRQALGKAAGPAADRGDQLDRRAPRREGRRRADRAAEGRRRRGGLGRGRGPGPHRRRRGRPEVLEGIPGERPGRASARPWPKAASCAPRSSRPTGKAAEAVRFYRRRCARRTCPSSGSSRPPAGPILARDRPGVPLLVEQLRSAGQGPLGIGLRVARELAGREVTEALVGRTWARRRRSGRPC